MKNDRLEMNSSLCFTCFLQAVSKCTCPTHSNLRISFLIIFFLQEKKRDSEINVIGVGRELLINVAILALHLTRNLTVVETAVRSQTRI